MIDTAILCIPKYQVKTTDGKDLLSWDRRDISSKKSYASIWIRNPTKEELATGNYFPRLLGYRRMRDYFVKIEFSVPKLLYGNNLDELENKDFEDIIHLLHQRLLDMEIMIDKKVLENAKVSAIHYSKNILLQDGYTSQYLIGELNKANKRKSFDNTTFRFENDGHSLQIYSKAHSFVIYDKIADMERPAKRAIDRDTTPLQASLFDELNKKQEIIRFEVRLSEYRKMVSIFKELQIKKEFTFKELFSKEISQKVVLHYWNTLIKNSATCYLPLTTPKELLNLICLTYPSMKSLKKIQTVGLLLLASDGTGLSELRAILAKTQDKRSWYKLMANLKEIAISIQKIKPRDWIYQIQNELQTYKSLQLKNINK